MNAKAQVLRRCQMLQILARTISSLATRQDGFDHLGETSEIGDNGTGCRDLMTVIYPAKI